MTRVFAVVFAGSVAWAGAAYADETVTGALKAINAATRTVTLDNDKSYSYLVTVDVSKMKVGDKVVLTFTPSTAVFQSLGIYGSVNKMAAAN